MCQVDNRNVMCKTIAEMIELLAITKEVLVSERYRLKNNGIDLVAI